MLRHISLLAPLALVAGPALAQTVHVRADLTTGANNGSTWADAFQGEDGLRAALAVATPGTEIWVAGGTYRAEPAAGPGLGFTVTTQSLTLRGGFVGTETSIFERTDPERRPVVLSGDAFGNDDGTAATLGDNALAVLRVLNAGRFTMEYVQVTDSANVGFLAEDSNARVSNCAFAGCLGSGGTVLGVGAFSTSGPGGRFDDCRFEDNGVDGLFFRGSPGTGEQVAIQRCVFRDNGRHGLSIGGDPSSVFQVQNSVFHRNGGSGVVLPLYIEGGTDVDLFQCTIAENDGVGILSTGSCGFCIFIPRCVGCLEWDNGTATSAIKYVGGLVEGSAAAAGFTAADVF
ncbi:MAG: right-handed parallel beta-helix repeat-containing protein, partial [Planctomycetota bacterium]